GGSADTSCLDPLHQMKLVQSQRHPGWAIHFSESHLLDMLFFRRSKSSWTGSRSFPCSFADRVSYRDRLRPFVTSSQRCHPVSMSDRRTLPLGYRTVSTGTNPCPR